MTIRRKKPLSYTDILCKCAKAGRDGWHECDSAPAGEVKDNMFK